MSPSRFAILTAASVSLLGDPSLAAAKKGSKAGSTKTEEPSPVQESEEGGFRKVLLDVNGDGHADVTNFYRAGEGDESRLLVRKEVDLNFDGRIDVVQIWESGSMTREEIDADFDGRTDWKDFYDKGERIRAEWDTQFDGKADLIRYYEGGKLARVEMDTDDNTTIDYWEYYQDGVMQRAGWDTNGDGKIDKWGEK